MKKCKLLILGVSLMMLLSGCKGGNKVVYKLTFHQDEAEDKVVDVIPGETTNEDVKKQEPEIVEKEGYEQSWVYDATTLTSDTTITPSSTLITYYATFMADGVQVGEQIAFNVETTELDEPLVPLKNGYYGEWEEYEIAARNLTINAVYTPITFHAKFWADGVQVGETIDFNIETTYIDEPEVPNKVGYTGEWEDYEIGAQDLNIDAIYTPITYYATFMADGEQVGDPVAFTVDQTKIDEPKVPSKIGYTGAWEPYQIKAENLTINAIYTLSTYYATFMADGEQVGDPVPFNINTVSINEPNVPTKAGYTGEWENYSLEPHDITINALYSTITYHAYFYDESGSFVGDPVEFTVESKSIDEPAVPVKKGYDGKWEEYQIKAEDLHIHPVYEIEKYNAIFKDGEVEVGTVKYDINDTIETVLSRAPQTPYKGNYARVWNKEFKLTYDKNVDTIIEIKEVKKYFDFEDSIIPEELTANSIVTGVQITDNGVDNSKALEVSVKSGDFKFGFVKSYLDIIFADSEVAAIAFDAKSTIATQNWRYCTPEGEPSSTNPAQPFEDYAAGAGITTSFKTFFFTRKMYNSWVENDSFMVKGAIGAVGQITIDNVRPVDYDIYNNKSKFGFETNTITSSSSNAFSVRCGTNKEGLSVSGAGVAPSSWSYCYDNKTEGNRSLKFSKQNGYVALYLNREIINSIPGDYVVFDLYTTCAFNSTDSNKGMCTGKSGVINNQKQTPNSKWFTLCFNKTTDITEDGRLLQIQGSPVCDVYIDNIRGIDEIDNFESAYSFHAGQYGYALDYKTEQTTSAGDAIRDRNMNYSFLVNGANCADAGVTFENATNGQKAVKFTYSAKGYCALFINPLLLDIYLPKGFKIAFDILATNSFTGGSLMGDFVNAHINEWTTVTLSETDFEKAKEGSSVIYNGRFFSQNFNGEGSFTIDHLRLISPEQ